MGGQDHLYGVGCPAGYGEVMGSEAAYRGMLPDIHGSADKTLAVDKILEGEGEV